MPSPKSTLRRARRERDRLTEWVGVADLTDGELYRVTRMRDDGHSGVAVGKALLATRAWVDAEKSSAGR